MTNAIQGEEHRFSEGRLITVQQHILQEQQRFPGASGEFSWLLSGITLATKLIEAKVRRAGLSDILGAHGDVNVQGEVQQKLDVYANEVLAHCLSVRESIGVLASEENEQPMLVQPAARRTPSTPSCSIRSTARRTSTSTSASARPSRSCTGRTDAGTRRSRTWVLQPGTKQVAAGYVVYGSSTMLVYSVGNGVHGFTLDPAIGAYVLSHENIRMPEQGKYYSVNEANRDTFPPALPRLHRSAADRRAGATVRLAVHRLDGGRLPSHAAQGRRVPLPADEGSSRRQAAAAVRGQPDRLHHRAGRRHRHRRHRRILDIEPESIHQRTSLVCGSRKEMSAFAEMFA